MILKLCMQHQYSSTTKVIQMMTLGWPLTFLQNLQIYSCIYKQKIWTDNFSETIKEQGIISGLFIELNKYIKIYECRRSRSFFWPLSKVTQILPVSHLLLWSCWANWSELSYGASIGWRNNDSFKQLGSHDQDGRHACMWLKPLKIFFFGTYWLMSLKLAMKHRALEYYLVSSNDDPRLIFDLFTQRSAVVLYAFIWKKLKRWNLLSNYWSLWYRGWYYSKLKWVHVSK